MILIETIWARIVANEGETFHQIRGKEYTYEVVGSSIIPKGINQNIPISEFEKAIELLPLENTVEVQHLRGPSYIFSILMDPRIRRQDEWGNIDSANSDR